MWGTVRKWLSTGMQRIPRKNFPTVKRPSNEIFYRWFLHNWAPPKPLTGMRRVVPLRIIHSGERLFIRENSVYVVKRRVDTPYCLCRKVATLRIIYNRDPMALCNVYSGVDTKRTWRKHDTKTKIKIETLNENGHGHTKNITKWRQDSLPSLWSSNDTEYLDLLILYIYKRLL